MIGTTINGRWTLRLPEHRHLRPEWPWWEATRLAAEHHVIADVLGRPRGIMSVPGVLGPQRPVVWVAGAEEGDFPALYSTWGADVVLAEPNPLVWPNIKAIWEANGLRPPVASFAGFLSDENRPPEVEDAAVLTMLVGSGQAERPETLRWWPASAEGPVIGDHGFARVEERPDLPAARIDTLVAAGWPPPDVLTIDVEGAEAHVLRGAAQTLREHRPHVFVSIHQEFARHHYGDPDVLRSVEMVLADAGYATTDVERSRFLAHDHESHWWWAP